MSKSEFNGGCSWWYLLTLAVVYLVIVLDGLRRNSKFQFISAMVYEVALISLLLMPSSNNIAFINLLMQKMLLGFVFSGLVLTLIAID